MVVHEKKVVFFDILLISGSRQPNNDIDVYLALLLIDDLNTS